MIEIPKSVLALAKRAKASPAATAAAAAPAVPAAPVAKPVKPAPKPDAVDPVAFIAPDTFESKAGRVVTLYHVATNGILPTAIREVTVAAMLRYDRWRQTWSGTGSIVATVRAALEKHGVQVFDADDVESAKAAAKALPQLPIPDDVQAKRDAAKAERAATKGRTARPAAAAPAIVILPDGTRAVIVDGRALPLADQGEGGR